MLYPIYDYYYESHLNLAEILSHYVENYYYRKHGKDKYEKILTKLSESDNVKKLFEHSYKQKLAINNVDFGCAINGTMWFMLQSNETQVVAIMVMALIWNEKVNKHLHLISYKDLRDDILTVFRKFHIYKEMTREEFDSMRNFQTDEFEEEKKDRGVEGECANLEDDEFPNAIMEKMNDPDFQDKMLAIMAEGGTKEQIKNKLEYLIGAKKKPDDIIEMEENLRHLFRDIFDRAGMKLLKENNNHDIMYEMKATTILYELNKQLEDENNNPDINNLKNAANQLGISWNIIKSEEYKRALAIYRDGETID